MNNVTFYQQLFLCFPGKCFHLFYSTVHSKFNMPTIFASLQPHISTSPINCTGALTSGSSGQRRGPTRWRGGCPHSSCTHRTETLARALSFSHTHSLQQFCHLLPPGQTLKKKEMIKAGRYTMKHMARYMIIWYIITQLFLSQET